MKQYDSRLYRFLVAVAAAASALVMCLATESFMGVQAEWLWFVLAVAVSAWFGGLKPGLITACPLLAAGYYLDSTRAQAGALPNSALHPFGVVSALAPSPALAALLYLVTAVVICAAMQQLRMKQFGAQQTGHRLHNVLESTPDAILSLDNEFRCLYANVRAGLIAKKQPAHLYGKSLRTLFPETPSVIIYKELHRALRERAPVHFEDRLELSNTWFEFDAYPADAGLNLFVRDISAKKAAEVARSAATSALETEHLRLESVLREMPVGVLIVSAGFRVELANQTAADLFGQSFDVGDDLNCGKKGQLRTLSGVVIEPDEWPLSRTLTTGERALNVELEYTDPGGTTVTLVVNTIPITGANGKLRGAMGTYTDVTSNRRMQKALGVSEARLRRLFDSPIIGVISGNEDSILEANDAFLTMLGYSREDLSDGGLKWAEITPQEFSERDANAIVQLNTSGFADQFEKEYIARDGHRVPVLIGSAAYDPGHWAPWIDWVLDRSEHRKLENRLRESAKLESIGLLAGGIAHDFNNILTSILGNASLAFEKLQPTHPARGLLEDTLRATERAADLTRQLLAYAGKGHFIVRAVDLSDLILEISRLLRTSIPRNVELDLSLPKDLPPLEADATQLQQLIMNLVINGAEAIGERAGTVRVTVKAIHASAQWLQSAGLNADLKAGEYLSMEVEDDGCGMDAATLRLIFDPFFTTKFTGRGLGLAAATGIVRAHRGGMHVRSSLGSGSLFHIVLPVSSTYAVAPRQEYSPDAIPGSGTILVVDDEEMIRTVAKTSLERYGYTVLLASDGKEALDIYRGVFYSISLVVLDLTMPRMSGEETLGNLRAINPAAKVLMTSGFDEMETVGRLTGKGLAGFLQKPFTAAALASKVREIIDVHKSDRVAE
ncbi:MAG: two-component system, cell cycle sensor histidine kinase and response regulator CckA [Bryobacterales bacterium]|nr:two-component system, cell cycle sensor histidine kinase and response regulator CckA [Bryobacterales bacterium]